MRDETFDSEHSADWNPVALRGGLVSLRVPSSWQRLSRDDGGLAFQSPGPHPVDLLISIVTYRNPYGVRAEEAIQYLDRENVLPRGILPSMETGDGPDDADERHWIAYAVAQPPDRQIFVWKVADFQPPDHVRVVTLQLLVPGDSAADPELSDLIDRLGEEAARIKFHPGPIQGPVQRVTMRNVWHSDSVRFRLPWDWQTLQEGDLTLFHREMDGAGTLRVAMHQFDHTGDDGEILARAVLRQTAEQFADGPDGRVGEGSVEWMPDGEVMARFVTDGEEDGEQLRFFLWMRGAALEGKTTVALFSFAFPQSSRGGDLERTTLAMLEQEIRRAVVGITDSTEIHDEEDELSDGFSLADLLDDDDLLDSLDDDDDLDIDEDDEEEDGGDEGGPIGRA
ncbi:hypothetical protein [Niveispirillum cyanobacteriorum]|uniref:hypothetical protein n=1 Tax=Niveispirillum cyanobacteriorum TaxID=1612173 RepID=UPI001319F847|nr:hypothetical protein [Niveispirillum cyanobacteriorum]GGE53184.1 hypothetical protein GCM10011317_09290 [Niveispirillum cyanobacteriorum]